MRFSRIVRKITIFLAVALATIGTYDVITQHDMKASDSYIRDRVLKLTSDKGQCSAISIMAPSGKVYTLTAAHCSALVVRAHVDATDEQGIKKKLAFIAIDSEHDLMLLSAFDTKKSIDVARSSQLYDKIHTLTHGNGMPTYRTDGELLADKQVEIAGDINSEDDMKDCQGKNKRIVNGFFGVVCLKIQVVTITTAQVVGGSSGGPAVDKHGHLIGIVSCGMPMFSGVVPLKDIRNFLKNR